MSDEAFDAAELMIEADIAEAEGEPDLAATFRSEARAILARLDTPTPSSPVGPHREPEQRER